MEKRTLGKTGLELSILGLGGFHLLETRSKDSEIIIDEYLDRGGNYVETAAFYGDGESEIKIGKVVKRRRRDCVLATKCHERRRKEAAELIDRSLRNLRVEAVDILYMHMVTTEKDVVRIFGENGAIRAAEDAREAGKTRFIGITTHGVPDATLEAIDQYPFDVVMTHFNYFDRFNFPKIEEELLPKARDLGMGIVGMKALADGFLYKNTRKAFRYTLSLPVTSIVAGANTMEMLEEDIRIVDAFRPMSPAELEALFKEAPELGNYVCRQCEKCLPCPEGIDIPRVFELEGHYDRQMTDGRVRDPSEYALRERLKFWYGNIELARGEYKELKVKIDACTSCGECVPRCPYELPIIEKFRIAEYKLTGGPTMP